MAVEEGMIVTFNADVSGLQKGAAAAVSSLDKVDKEASQAAKSLGNIPKVSNQVASAAANMARASGTLGGSLDKAKAASGSATQALVNLSRVAQDAPFGFIGIANNLNPLLESFQRLRAESGSGATALKALGSSLLGAGGVGLALGVVSSLLVVFGDQLFNSKTKAEDHANTLKKAREALQGYVEGLNDVNRANVVGNQNAQEELVKLKTLYDASQNQNISLANRKKIVDELQSQWPQTFKNISDEVILAGGASEAYKKLASSILSAARARAAQDTLVDVQKQLLAAEQKRADNTVEQIKIQQKLNTLKSSGNEEISLSLTGESRLTATGAEAIKIENRLNDARSDGRDISKEILGLQIRAKTIASQVTAIVEKDPTSLLTPGKGDKVKPQVKVEPRVTFDPEKFIIPPHEVIPAIDALEADLAHQLSNTTVDLSAVPKFRFPVVSFDTSAFIKFVREEEAKAAFAKKLDDFNKELNALASTSLNSAFINIGESLGSLFSGGGFASILQSIGGVFGDFLQSLGKMLIKQAIQIQLFKKAFATLLANPIAAIAVGVSLVAIGAAIKNATMPKPRGFKTGGVVPPGFPNDTFPAFLTSGERIIPAGQAGNARATGGITQTVLAGDWRISGRDLVFVQSLENKQQGSFR